MDQKSELTITEKLCNEYIAKQIPAYAGYSPEEKTLFLNSVSGLIETIHIDNKNHKVIAKYFEFIDALERFMPVFLADIILNDAAFLKNHALMERQSLVLSSKIRLDNPALMDNYPHTRNLITLGLRNYHRTFPVLTSACPIGPSTPTWLDFYFFENTSIKNFYDKIYYMAQRVEKNVVSDILTNSILFINGQLYVTPIQCLTRKNQSDIELDETFWLISQLRFADNIDHIIGNGFEDMPTTPMAISYLGIKIKIDIVENVIKQTYVFDESITDDERNKPEMIQKLMGRIKILFRIKSMTLINDLLKEESNLSVLSFALMPVIKTLSPEGIDEIMLAVINSCGSVKSKQHFFEKQLPGMGIKFDQDRIDTKFNSELITPNGELFIQSMTPQKNETKKILKNLSWWDHSSSSPKIIPNKKNETAEVPAKLTL